jgi:hypothetical protein
MADGTIITSVIDTLAICSSIIESAENEVVYLSPLPLLVLAPQFSLTEKTKVFIRKGGRMRGIADISYPYIEKIRDFLDNGVDVHHFHQYPGIFMLVGDEKESISTMSIDAESFSIDTPLVALWSDDPTYADYLMSTFETAWEQSVSAAQRIEELLKEGPPKV